MMPPIIGTKVANSVPGNPKTEENGEVVSLAQYQRNRIFVPSRYELGTRCQSSLEDPEGPEGMRRKNKAILGKKS